MFSKYGQILLNCYICMEYCSAIHFFENLTIKKQQQKNDIEWKCCHRLHPWPSDSSPSWPKPLEKNLHAVKKERFGEIKQSCEKKKKPRIEVLTHLRLRLMFFYFVKVHLKGLRRSNKKKILKINTGQHMSYSSSVSRLFISSWPPAAALRGRA